MFGINFKFSTFFGFYIQFFKTSLFPSFSHFFQIFSNYKYTLAHFQQTNFSKKLDKLFPKFHAYSTTKKKYKIKKRPKRALTKNVYKNLKKKTFFFLGTSSNFEIFLKKICTMPLHEALLYSLGGIWFVFLNNHFQFLNNISRILTHFFTHTYFHKYF